MDLEVEKMYRGVVLVKEKRHREQKNLWNLMQFRHSLKREGGKED